MSFSFEMIERDGQARICNFITTHGKVETPAIVPVINPSINSISPSEMRESFGTEMVITNAYIIFRKEELRREALEKGIHELLKFDGTIMTDCGTFQSHVYGQLPLQADEILDFQMAIGADIVTVLDIFSEPFFSRKEASDAVEITAERVRRATVKNHRALIAGTVQGSLYTDIRERAARSVAASATDYYTIGGVVPLLESYRYRELVDVIVSSKRGLPPGRPVHLFGAGNPLTLPLAVMLGCDLFDSASYAKYAADGRMMFGDRTVRLEELRINPCDCDVCISNSVRELIRCTEEERRKLISLHNLHVLHREIQEIKDAIYRGELWKLVERKARARPELYDAHWHLGSYRRELAQFEPLSRRSTPFVTDTLSTLRPDIAHFTERASEIRPGSSKTLIVIQGKGQYFSLTDFRHYPQDCDLVAETALGIYPLGLTETYPLAQSVFSDRMRNHCAVLDYARKFGYERIMMAGWKRRAGRDLPDQTRYMEMVRNVCEYQFGADAARLLLQGDSALEVSPNTGKLRHVTAGGKRLLFFRPEDGLFSLHIEGARRLHGAAGLHITASPDAVPFIREGKSLFCRFVEGASSELRPGDECIIVERNGSLVASGRCRMNAREMLSFKRGIAADIRETVS